MCTNRKYRRGISLTEMAVVLGVFGIIASGVWSSISAVQRTSKYNQFALSTAQAVESIRTIYGSTAGIYWDYAGNTNEGLLGAVGLAGPQPTPWGGNTNVRYCAIGVWPYFSGNINQCDMATSLVPLPTFGVQLNIPNHADFTDACVKILTGDMLASSSGLVEVVMLPAGFAGDVIDLRLTDGIYTYNQPNAQNPLPTPIPVSTAQKLCKAQPVTLNYPTYIQLVYNIHAPIQ